MFDIYLRNQLLDDAVSKTNRLLPSVEHSRYMWKAYYIASFVTALTGFGILFITYIIRDKFPSYTAIITASGIITSSIVVLSGLYLKRTAVFLNWIITRIVHLRQYVDSRRSYDPFFYHFYVTIILVYIPFFLLIALCIFKWDQIIYPNSPLHNETLENLKQFLSFALAITGIQLALFSFMFSHLLGRYSYRIVGALNTHKAVLSLWVFPIASLACLWIFMVYGFPKKIHNLLTPTFLLTDISCLAITIWTLNSGINPEYGVLYTSRKYCSLIKRKFKPLTVNYNSKPSYFWRVLGCFGLDWRDPERLRPFEPPVRSSSLAKELICDLFNTANKSIQDNQQTMLAKSLAAILNVHQTYINIRKSYYGSRDVVLEQINNQMTALLKAAAKSPDEYMVMLVVRATGAIGVMVQDIETLPLPVEDNSPLGISRSPKTHEMSLLWAGSLVEGFEYSHTLMRSTAASEAIIQLTNIALAALRHEYYGSITSLYFTNIGQIHQTCISSPDAYHRELGRQSIASIMKVWLRVAGKPSPYAGGIYDTYDQCVKTISMFSIGQFSLDKHIVVDFNGTGTQLVSKTNDQHIVIQDIFYITMKRSISKKWERRTAINDLSKTMKLISTLATTAVEKSAIDSWQFVKAFYEIGYLIVRGLPDSLVIVHEDDEFPLLNIQEVSGQDELESELYDIWRKIYSLFFGNHINGSDWESYLVGLLCIGLNVNSNRKSEALNEQLVKCITVMKQLIEAEQTKNKRNIDKQWAYLQLVGACLYHFNNEGKLLAENIADSIASQGPSRNHMFGSSSTSKYAIYGYPTVMGHFDFSIPRLGSIENGEYLSEKDIENLIIWNTQVTNEKMLIKYYEKIEEARRRKLDSNEKN